MMFNRDRRLADLQSALEAFGADRGRWPAQLRNSLSTFIAGDAEAQRLVKEAEALDRLLDAAPMLSAERMDALASRIGALAERQPRVIHANEQSDGRAARIGPSRFGAPRRDSAFAAAALAASLLLGIFAGQTPAIDPGAALLIETSASDDGAAQRLAASEDTDILLYEDLL